MRFSELEGARIAVWGAGLETRSFGRQLAAHLPQARIGWLIVEDEAPGASPIAMPTSESEPDLLTGPGPDAHVVRAREVPALATEIDVLVRSPGVSIHRPEVVALVAAGIPTATPTALWLAERSGRNTIGITATKGKSTTAALTAHLARAAGLTVHLAGNIGDPALDLVGIPDDELVVLELSSYQTADLTVGPQTAVASNLFREHLNWHLTEEAYAREKLRLLDLPGVEHCVVGALSEPVMAAPTAPGAEVLTFGVAPGWCVTRQGVEHGCALAVPSAALPLPGDHNALNLCAALTALDAHGIARPPLPDALAGFAALPHRLELVREEAGVRYIDDSISTTTESAIVAIDSFPDVPIILLGGGLDRGQEYAALGARLAEREATVITMPQTGNRLAEAARAAGVPESRIAQAADLAEAVAVARERAVPGTVVLLSPAAPSYHAYRDFKARGAHFRELLGR